MGELGEKLAEAHAQGTLQQLQEAEQRTRAVQAACARKVSARRSLTQALHKESKLPLLDCWPIAPSGASSVIAFEPEYPQISCLSSPKGTPCVALVITWEGAAGNLRGLDAVWSGRGGCAG